MSRSRTVRIFWDDPDVTDSSSEDDGCGGARRVGRMVRELPPAPVQAAAVITAAGGFPEQCCPGPGDDDRSRRLGGGCAGSRKRLAKGAQSTKFRGVRRRPWGKFAAEICNQLLHLRGGLGGGERRETATPVAAGGGYESGAESSQAVSSPTSVLCKVPSMSSLVEDRAYDSEACQGAPAAAAAGSSCSLTVLEELGEFVPFEDAPVYSSSGFWEV